LTAREVAEMIGVSSETILRWTRRGVIPGFRLPGGALRYREGELEQWLAGRRCSDQRSITNGTRP
jgi:excisionase family DNA binding protein